MESKSCIVRGILALMLRLMRVFALAPVTITRDWDGYRIQVSKLYAIMGYIGIIFLNILHLYCGWVDMWVKKKYNIVSNTLPLVVLLWLVDIFLGTAVFTYGAFFAISRMKNMIAQVSLMNKLKVDTESKRKRRNTKTIAIIMMAYRIFLDIFHFSGNLSNVGYVHDIVLYSYFFTRLKYFALCSLHVFVYVLYEEIVSKLQDVRHELQNLADLLEFEYIDSSPAFTESVNTRIQNVGKALEFLREIFVQMNKSNEYMVFLIYMSLVSRLIQSGLNVIMFSAEGTSASLVLFVLFVFHHTLSLVMFVEPFRGIKIEMQAMKLLVARIATTRYVTDSIPPPLDMLYGEVSASDFYFSPLGVFTIRRSLLTKTMGAAVSYLVIVIQFKIKC